MLRVVNRMNTARLAVKSLIGNEVEKMKTLIKTHLLSLVIYLVANIILYTQVGNIIDWTIFVLSLSAAYGVVVGFEQMKGGKG